MSSIEDIKIKFPKELEELLEFEEYPELVTVRGKRFLETGDFRKVSAIVKSLGGEYVSNGAKSHFKVPRQQASKPEVSRDVLVKEALELMKRHTKEIRAFLDKYEKE